MRNPNLRFSHFLIREWAGAGAALTCAALCGGCVEGVQGVSVVAMLWESYSATTVIVAATSKIGRNLTRILLWLSCSTHWALFAVPLAFFKKKKICL
jgi:hypothetical protein